MRATTTSIQGIGRLAQAPACAPALLLTAVFPLLAVIFVATAAGAASDSLPTRTLDLAEAIDLALANDEQLAQMQQAVLGAEADVMAAGADRLPQLSLAGSWTRNLKKPVFFLPADMAARFGGATSVEMGMDWDLAGAATLSWNLWTSGRLSAAKGLADEALRATRWQEALVRDAVVFTAVMTYDDALLAAENLAIAEGALDLSAETLRITQAAFDEGTASRFDLLRAKVEHTNRETPVVMARNDLDLALLKLKRLCGLDPETRLELSDDLNAVEAPAPVETLLTDMNDRSPELHALEHAVFASERALDLAKAGRGPIVQLQGQYAVQGQWDDDLFPGDDEAVGSATAALVVSVPIFDGFKAKADIKGGRADLRSAQLELDRVRRDRELGVRQARAQLVNARTALGGRREAVELAEEAYRLATVRMENGLATPVDRLDAELALTEARGQLAEALYGCRIAAANLELAVGGAHDIDNNEESDR